jgi:23S rRNA (adenine2503-C2)-methyltransferase
MSETKTNPLDLDRDAMRAFFVELGEKPFRADQIMKWIYHFGCDDFDQMSNVATRRCAASSRPLPRIRAPEISQTALRRRHHQMGAAGGRSGGRDRLHSEADRAPCASPPRSAAPWRTFCSTAQQGLQPQPESRRDHRPGVACRQSGGGKRPITNVVMMGMGEPLQPRQRGTGHEPDDG